MHQTLLQVGDYGLGNLIVMDEINSLSATHHSRLQVGKLRD
jgi:hypothetical protein